MTDFVGIGGQRSGPCGHGLGFHIATEMPRIGHNGEQSARAQPFERYLHSSEGGVGLGNAGFVVPRKPAEIEHDRSQPAFRLGRKSQAKVVMAVVDQGADGEGVGSDKSRASARDRFSLEIKGENSPARHHEVGQKQRVVTIPCGGINHPIARVH